MSYGWLRAFMKSAKLSDYYRDYLNGIDLGDLLTRPPVVVARTEPRPAPGAPAETVPERAYLAPEATQTLVQESKSAITRFSLINPGAVAVNGQLSLRGSGLSVNDTDWQSDEGSWRVQLGSGTGKASTELTEVRCEPGERSYDLAPIHALTVTTSNNPCSES